jgi:hypothetical protein
MGNNTSSEYHKMVWQKAKEETESYFNSDWRSWMGSIITGIATGTFSFWWTNLLGDTSMIHPLVAIIIIAASTLFGLAIFVVGLWGWNGLWNIPATLYRKKESEANKYTWKDMEIKIAHRSPNDPILVCLDVTNNKNDDIYDANVKIQYLQKGFYPVILTKDYSKNLCWAISKESGFIWSGNKLGKGIKNTLVLTGWFIANGNPILMTGDLNENNEWQLHPIELDINCEYQIRLEWFGKINNNNMEKFEKSYQFKFQKDSLSIVEIFEREQ